MILESLVLMTSYLFVGCGGGESEITEAGAPAEEEKRNTVVGIEQVWRVNWAENNNINIKYLVSTDNEKAYLETAKKLKKGECMEIYWSDRIKFETLNNEEYESKISETDKYTHYTCKK